MESIKVAIRIKPTSSTSNCWLIGQEKETISQYSCCSLPEGKSPTLLSTFTFDRIFDQQDTTKTIYHSFCSQIVEAALSGINGTIFAYGQTSSGKTFTMQGIIRLAVEELLCKICGNEEFQIKASYLEIYNEVISDLLNCENKNLKIHQSVNGGIFVGSATECITKSERELLELLEAGETNRTIGATSMNEKSSRSHAILRLVVSRKQIDSGTSQEATLNFVDLAGSERAGQTGAEGIRLKEGGHINKSLLALSSVIGKLAESTDDCSGGHIPFRDSKLTRILQPFLGGNGKTLVICTVSLQEEFEDETLSTLKFASRAKCIQNRPIANVTISNEAMAKNLQNELFRMKEQVACMIEGDSENLHQVKEELNLLKNALKLVKDDLILNFQAFTLNHQKISKKLQEKALHLVMEKDAYETCYMEIERDFNAKIEEFAEEQIKFHQQLKDLQVQNAALKAEIQEKDANLKLNQAILEENREEIARIKQNHLEEKEKLQNEIVLLKAVLAEKDEKEAKEVERASLYRQQILKETDERIGNLLGQLSASEFKTVQFERQFFDQKKNVLSLYNQINKFKNDIEEKNSFAKMKLLKIFKEHFKNQSATNEYLAIQNHELLEQIQNASLQQELFTEKVKSLSQENAILTSQKEEEISREKAFFAQKIEQLQLNYRENLVDSAKEFAFKPICFSFERFKNEIAAKIHAVFLEIQRESSSSKQEINRKLFEASETVKKQQIDFHKKQISFERILKSIEASEKGNLSPSAIEKPSENAIPNEQQPQPKLLLPKKRKMQ